MLPILKSPTISVFQLIKGDIFHTFVKFLESISIEKEFQKMEASSKPFAISKTNTSVKPVHKGHSREPENVAFRNNCPLYTN
jgi:hypothetical protein